MEPAEEPPALEPAVEPAEEPPALEPEEEPSHNQCCLSYGAHGSSACDELSHLDWDNLMKACDDAERKETINQQATINTINQQAVKKGDKVIILNNCSGITFNL